MLSTLRALSLTLLLAGAQPAVAVAQSRLAVEGTEFVLTLDDGRTLRSMALKGTTLKMTAEAGAMDVTLQSVGEDPHAVGGRVFLHRFVTRDAGGKVVDSVPARRRRPKSRLSNARRARRLHSDLHQRCHRQVHPLGLSSLG